jgi:hypothetical protein
MFRCQMCNVIVPKKTQNHRIVVKTRSKSYASRGTHFSERRGSRRSANTERRPDYDKGGEGREIVQELSVCDECAKQHKARTEAITP